MKFCLWWQIISVRPLKHHRSHSAEKSCSTEIVCENMPRQVTFPRWGCEKFSPFLRVSLCDFHISTSLISVSPLSVGPVHNDRFRPWLPLPALPAGTRSAGSFLCWSCRCVGLYGWWLGALWSWLLHLLHAALSSHCCVLTNLCRSWCMRMASGRLLFTFKHGHPKKVTEDMG